MDGYSLNWVSKMMYVKMQKIMPKTSCQDEGESKVKVVKMVQDGRGRCN